jgi:hypothetical protein
VVVDQGVAQKSDFVEWISVLAFVVGTRKSVDEVTVQNEGHVVEEERFEGFKGRGDLLVRCAVGNGFDKFLVRSKLVIERRLALVNFLLCVFLTAEHRIASFADSSIAVALRPTLFMT